MEMKADYEKLLRDRITQLRVKKNVSEHRMSLDLGKSGQKSPFLHFLPYNIYGRVKPQEIK